MYIFATQMLNFIKKYPMSILLAIIAINLFSIARSLRTEAEINRDKLICIKWTKNQLDDNETYKKLGSKRISGADYVGNTCKVISSY